MEPIPGGKTDPVIYLNNAATTWPKPPEVIAEVTNCLQIPFSEHGRSTLGNTPDYLTDTRDCLSRFFGVDLPDQFVFTSSATDALNILIQGFEKKAGKPFHAVTTELEHNSVLRPLHTLETEGKISLSKISFKKSKVDLSTIKKAILPETRLVVMTHGSNVLGSIQDIQPIAEYLNSNGIYFIVDGAQTAGLIDINLEKIPVDAFVFTGHKALFGMPGIGGFFIRDPFSVIQTRYGGTGTESQNLVQPQAMPERFEIGTPNYPGIASLLAGIRFIDRIGLDAITDHNKIITAAFLHEIKTINNIELLNPHPELPVVSLNFGNVENSEAGYILAKAYNIVTRTGLHCAPLVHKKLNGGKGAVRASFSWFTTLEEVKKAGAAIREIADSCGS